ncbi:MAG: rRNA maturation RNase YbeY [bacterium]|nr:rRNA maturation RNase YbeY [bacterium]
MVNIITSSRYKINRKRIKNALGIFLQEKNLPADLLVNIIFVGRKKMKEITISYKHESETLPVLSFPFSKLKSLAENKTENHEEKLLGEVFICYPLAVLLAAERNKRVEDMIEWLIKHGVENLLK